jgi:Kef-type K+ transport system membrane component KefB
MEAGSYQIIVHIALLLFAAKLFGEIVARLNFPSVLGEILAGIILGPSALGWVTPDSPVQVISTIGILLLLFLAGLEIDLDMMKKMGMASLVVAIGGVVLPMTGGTLVFMAYGESFRSAVFIGSIMSATSIGLTLRTLMDVGKFRTREGTTVVTAAVIDDVIGIFILTLLISIEIVGETPSAIHILALLGMIVAFFASSLVAGWLVAPRLTKWTSRMWIDEALLAFSICLAIALGWVASSVKMAEITGAFVAGLMLNKTNEKRVISEKTSIVGYGFFIPIFFAFIGVNTELSALLKAGSLTVIFVAIAIFGKILGCGIAARPWFKTRQSLAIGVGMIPRAEVALIMATVGLNAGAIDNRIFIMTVTMVFVTNIVTPIFLKMAFKGVE